MSFINDGTKRNTTIVGKKMNQDVGLFINDNKGRPRIKIYIDNDNNPRIELLNEEGNVLIKE